MRDAPFVTALPWGLRTRTCNAEEFELEWRETEIQMRYCYFYGTNPKVAHEILIRNINSEQKKKMGLQDILASLQVHGFLSQGCLAWMCCLEYS